MSHKSSKSLKLGRMNRLDIIQKNRMGLILEGDVLLPRREIPRNQPTDIGNWVEVFVYHDGSNRLIATTTKPYTEVGKFADLQVVEINDFGIFFDWGLPKDLMLPFSEELGTLHAGDFAIVYTYLDDISGRITATMKIEQYLDQTPADYVAGEEVDLVVENRTDMGFKVIINHAHWGLIHNNELFKEIHTGDEIKGFIKQIREDGKLDVSLQPSIAIPEVKESLEEEIMRKISEYGGILPVSDKSPPHEIHRIFGVSKGVFKRTIGGLFKEGKIIIEPLEIRYSPKHIRKIEERE